MPEDVRKTGDGSLTLFSERYQETYHSNMGAALEARELYLVRSGFLASLDPKNPPLRCSILDVGLGLGYNAMSALEVFFAFASPASKLHLISLESDQNLIASLLSGKASWQEFWPQSWLALLEAKTLDHDSKSRVSLSIRSSEKIALWDILIGDARETLNHFLQDAKDTALDYIFQDPFSPHKNPELWTNTWFMTLYRHVGDKSVLASYSVARSVKDALTQANWNWVIVPGMGQKKHWLIARPIKE